MDNHNGIYPTRQADAVNGLWLQWSRVNLAWLLMWHDQILGIYTTREEAEDVYDATQPHHLP